MGNHAVGRAMVAVAEVMADRRKPGETALDILDIAADKTEIRGADAEFDDAPDVDGPFRSLLIEAFGDGDTFEDDDEGERFYDKVYEPFNKRYELC
jgi:hypothetical protein